jgi:pimeloyl-ACP methyl ester carboxylesterase
MRLAAAVVSTCVMVAGLAAPTVARVAAVPFTPPPIQWGACADPNLRQAGATCGDLVVPLDYAHPDGAKITLAVSRVLHTSPDAAYQGVMLTNPGGPGGSGLILSVLGRFVPNHAGDAYDWIGFDPRGVGASRPSLSCVGRYFHLDRPDYVPRTRHLMRVWLARSGHYARACAKARGHGLLAHSRTRDTVRDMDSLREALGAATINYYGFSYGTYLGQVYATLHPTRVRRFVLDSNVDPRAVWYRANLNQDVAFDRNIEIYFRWLARYDRVYHLGSRAGAVERRFYRQLTRLDRHPAGGVLGPDELTDVFTDAGYSVQSWEAIARAYADLRHHGRSAGLVRLYRSSHPVGPGADNQFAMYLATECTDAPWPQSWARQRRDNRRLYRKHPFLTWDNAWFNAPCTHWHAAAGRPVRVDGRAVSQPVLLVDETKDAATPFQGSLEVRGRFPSSSLIAGVGGTTHAASLSGVACVDDAIATYLSTGVVPARRPGRRADKACPPVPQPHPTASRSRGLAPQSLRQTLSAARMP